MRIAEILLGGGKNRQSNIELARLISMFLILVIHANMVSLQRPTSLELTNNTFPVVARYLFESIGIVSVDVFVMISGWFLVRTRTKSVLSFIFQILFFWGIGYIVMLATNNAELSIKGFLNCFAFTSWDWFIKAYFVLFIISPILNAFIQNTNEKIQRNVIFWFFAFMCTYGWIGGASRFFVNGYGPLSFIGLYLLSNYARNAKDNADMPLQIKKLFCFNKYIDFLIFIIFALLNTIIGVISLKYELPLYGHLYAYISPIVIIGSLYFLLFFSKLEIRQNMLVNWLAAGSFSVYLLHSQFDIRLVFTSHVQKIYDYNNGLAAIFFIGVYLAFVYLISVIVDQVRVITWTLISKKIK